MVEVVFLSKRALYDFVLNMCIKQFFHNTSIKFTEFFPDNSLNLFLETENSSLYLNLGGF